MNAATPIRPSCEALAVHEIKPIGIYGVEDVKRILRLKNSTVRREVREGRLRVSKRAAAVEQLADATGIVKTDDEPGAQADGQGQGSQQPQNTP